jgi:hypothetical protein
MLVELERNADTFAEFAKALDLFGKHTMAEGLRIAEQSNRALLRAVEGG